jgi:hypothetical protein
MSGARRLRRHIQFSDHGAYVVLVLNSLRGRFLDLCRDRPIRHCEHLPLSRMEKPFLVRGERTLLVVCIDVYVSLHRPERWAELLRTLSRRVTDRPGSEYQRLSSAPI